MIIQKVPEFLCSSTFPNLFHRVARSVRNHQVFFLYRDCGVQSGLTTAPICSTQGKNTKSKFEITFDGFAFHFYNKETNMYMCRGSIDSDNGQFLVANASDSDQCWIARKWLVKDDLEEKPLYFCTVPPPKSLCGC